jgi:hypothetical protein
MKAPWWKIALHVVILVLFAIFLIAVFAEDLIQLFGRHHTPN